MEGPGAMHDTVSVFIFWMDILGTFVFGLTGAFRAIKYELDVFGVFVLSTAVGVGGGMTRDALLGLTPPAALRSPFYLLTTLLAGLCVFFFARKIAPGWRLILYADSVGLALFAAVGAEKAFSAGLGVVGVMVIAVIASVGGGVIRDVFTGEIPLIFTSDVYATAALAGGFFFWLPAVLHVPGRVPFWSAFAAVVIIRFIVMRYRIDLPKSKRLPRSPSQFASERKKKT